MFWPNRLHLIFISLELDRYMPVFGGKGGGGLCDTAAARKALRGSGDSTLSEPRGAAQELSAPPPHSPLVSGSCVVRHMQRDHS